MSDIHEKIRRSRRDLMLVSLVLAFTSYAGIHIKKLDLLGTEMDVTNPHAIQTALWCLWIYGLWRFWGQSSEIEKGIRLTYRLCLERCVKKCIETRPIGTNGYDINVYRKNQWIANEREFDDFGGLGIGKEIRIEGIEFLTCKISAATEVCISTSKCSEYILPYIIALIPIGMAIL